MRIKLGPNEVKDLGEINILPPKGKVSDKKFYIGRAAYS